MFRRILLFLGLLLIAFFVYRRYDQSAADTLLYTVKTLSPGEETNSNKSSGYITTFVSNEYDTGSKSSGKSEIPETTTSGNALQEVIDLSKQLSLGILSLTVAGLQGSTGQELLSTAEQEFNAIIEQALNATIEPDNNSTGSVTTGGTSGTTTTTTVATTPATTTTKTSNTTTKSSTTTKNSLSARDKEEAEAFLELLE